MGKNLTWEGRDVEDFSKEEIDAMSADDRDSFYVRRGISRIAGLFNGNNNDDDEE